MNFQGQRRVSEEVKFWSKVAVTANADKCWNWLAYKNERGYGQYGFCGKTTLSHRVAWCLTKGELPQGVLLHSCDNPACCNPRHLSVGTHQDNVRDMVSKNRNARGEKVGPAKLSEADVRTIKRRLKAGESCRKLAKEYGVCHSTISMISRGRNWGWLT